MGVGRKKRPLALVRAEGNPGKRKLPKEDEEIKPVAGIPEPPGWFDDVALEEWNRVAVQLLNLGLLTHMDRASLVCYCEAWSGLTKAKTEDNDTLALKYSNEIKRWCVEFGMTPSARARMSVPGKGKDDDEMETLLKRVR
jgi:phage terminase small subunit